MKKILYLLAGILLIACQKPETVPMSLPTVETVRFSEVSSNSALLQGEVSDDGNDYTTTGFCWSNAGQPSIESNKVVCGSGIGPFEYKLDNLEDGTSYNVRAYATNSQGTSYGQMLSFKTVSLTTLKQFLGTYDVTAYNIDEKANYTWSGTKIESYIESQDNKEWIKVNGILLGQSCFSASGKYDDVNKCIRLFSGYGYGTFTFKDDPNTTFMAFFYPISSSSDGTFKYVETGNSSGIGEAWLTMGEDGVVSLGPSDVADNNGNYADGFCFIYANASTMKSDGRFSAYKNVKLTKTSSTTTSSAECKMKICR